MSEPVTTEHDWNTQIVSVYRNVTMTSQKVTITWRNSTIRCCGQLVRVATSDSAPVWYDNYGELRLHVTECPGCGQGYVPPQLAAHDADGERVEVAG